MLRTHTCGELTATDIGKNVSLSGWVKRRRDLGNLIFLDLRDRYGITQIVINPAENAAAHTIGETIRHEYVIKVSGTVVARADGQANRDMATGAIEISAETIEILSKAETTPFEIEAENVREDLRLEYRYLDLRNARLQKNIKLRHDMVRTIREYFSAENFLEIETPIMVKGTPEGSREYLVPSRLHAGEFYVLPQSPQQLKQMCMVSGFDRYMQIAKCFRDEDLRGDRQPEFTQVDLEMSFVDQEDVINCVESSVIELVKNHAVDKMWKKFLVDGKLPRITWQDAMEQYGSDKPDLRFGLTMTNFSAEKSGCGFGVFEKSDHVFGLHVPAELKTFTRKEIDALTELAKEHGAGGLAWYRVGEESGAVAKNSAENFLEAIKAKTNAKDGDMIFFGAGKFMAATEPLGAVRLAVGDMAELRNPNEFAPAWIVDFPLFEEKDDGTRQAAHHPFTMPHPDDIAKLESDPMSCRALAYDIVMNGVELGGGSIRIHDRDLQHKLFSVLGLSEAEIEMKFGHILKAFQYGVPPHGGCALGLDRMVMLWADEPNIREVIAFPKNQVARDLMLGSPSAMPEAEVKEQNIQVV